MKIKQVVFNKIIRIFCRVLPVLLLLISTSAQARNNERDTLYLHNGELLIGEIREMKLGMLTIDSKDVGLITIKTSKIKTINTSSDTLRIETADKYLYFGALKPSMQEGHVYIVTAARTVHVPISSINSLMEFNRKFFDSFSGNVSSGFSFSHSSGIGQLTLNASVTCVARKFQFELTGSGISSIDTSTFSRDREDLQFVTYYNIKNSKWSVVGLLDYQRNLQLSIARRFQQLFGASYKLILNNNVQTLFLGGVNVNQEHSTTGEDENMLFEIPLGFEFDYFKFSQPNMQISSQHVFYTGLSQWGRIRYDSNTTINWELVHDFSISWNIYLNYDRQPPDPSAGKIDYGTVIGLSYKF